MKGYGCEGLHVVISGGTSGIGLAAAEKMLVDGAASVCILGRSQARGEAAVKFLLEKTGKEALYLPCDVSSQEDCVKAFKQLGVQQDILIASAGIYVEERLEQISEQSFELMDTNVKGIVYFLQAGLPYLKEGGSIVTVASDAGVSGNYGCPLYCASKGAVVALTRALALDLAPKVRVNCVCPADVDTPLLQKQLEQCGGSYGIEDMSSVYPLQRIAQAEEIAHVICSVASPLNSFMTGSIITVDGGLTAK